MRSLTEHDIKQIVLIKNKIFMFEKDKLDLFELICDLGGLLNELESVSEFWKDDFQAEVNALEIIHDSIEDGSISRWKGNYREDMHDAISKLKKMAFSILEEYLGQPDSNISESAIEGDSNWLICPKCNDAWESDSLKAVLKHTSFAIGGVPPIGYEFEKKPLIDEDLMQYSEIWAAAGTPNSVFQLSPGDLLQITQARSSISKNDQCRCSSILERSKAKSFIMKKRYFIFDADEGAPMHPFGFSFGGNAFTMPIEFSCKSLFLVNDLVTLSTILTLIDKLEAAPA